MSKRTFINIIKKILTIILISFGVYANAIDYASIAFSQGDYKTAIKLSSEIIDTAEDKNKTSALIRRGEAYRALGYLRDAQSDLETAKKIAIQQKDALLTSIASLALGQLLFQQQNYPQAKKILELAQQQAKTLKLPVIESSAINTLANILAHQDKKNAAIKLYRDAIILAEQTDDIALIVALRRNLIRALGPSDEALKQFKKAQQQALSIPNLYEQAELLLALSEESEFSNLILQQVLDIAQKLKSPKLLSQAKGKLGALYEQQHRYTEALTLTDQAITYAQQITNNDLLLQWQWQSARLLKLLGHRNAAISAYRRTVYYINVIRQDIPVSYQGGRSSFRETLSPIYIGLADLLLEQAALIAKPTNIDELINEHEQSLLREARDTIEQIKLSEIQDYLKDSCIINRTEKLETLAPNTAVLYPIILPKRLELLVSIGTKLIRYSTNVTAVQLQKSVNLLVKTLRPTSSGELNPLDKKNSKQLYQWLINPLLKQLKEQKIDTLVFVPDGVLRSLPIAALSDGKHYLIEEFAIATVPGLTLFDPKPLANKNMHALLAGLSQPGPVVLELPDAMWDGLVNQSSNNNRGIRGTSTTIKQLKPQEKDRSITERKVDMVNKVQQALALPGVEKEINQLSKHLQGQVLLDKNFLLSNFVSDISENPYRVVHIASHGFFGGSPEQNFLMTYDHKLNMDQLGSILKPKQLSDKPIELLTLSACQTAEGDDRSPLGMAGIALKSGARSILGTLWPIADDAAQQMLPSFYNNLIQTQTTKAKALQSAQLKLLKQKEFSHPFFWSAFILIGNWL
jgi:CHAT domain-containing protein